MPNNSRWHNYGLWASIAAFIPLLLSALGIQIIPDGYEEIVNAFLAILVMAGLISNPTTDSKWFLDGTNKEKPTDKKE